MRSGNGHLQFAITGFSKQFPDMNIEDHITKAEECISYQFKDKGLLQLALTHSSLSDANYERLEFLGDRVLGIIIAEDIYKRFETEQEGSLARRLSALVRKETLAEISVESGLSQFVIVSEHEKIGAVYENESVFADVVESVLGALYLDGGLDVCRTYIETNWGARLQTLAKPVADPKTALQEWLQGRGMSVPHYVVIEKNGPDHAPEFTIEVQIEGVPHISAMGNSKREAEKKAAKKMLSTLKTGQS